MKIFFLFLITILISCHGYIYPKTSLKGYQAYDTLYVNNLSVVKFNNSTFKQILESNPKAKYVILFHYHLHCGFSIARQKSLLKSTLNKNQEVFLIPIVYDYERKVKAVCEADTSLIKQLYFPDLASYPARINPIMGYEKNFLRKYSHQDTIFFNNFYFDYQAGDKSIKKVFFYNSGDIEQIDSMILKSLKVKVDF